MFEIASKNKLRFHTHRGIVTVEDLWDMPMTGREPLGFHLNGLARTLYRKILASSEDNFVSEKPTEDSALEFQLDIVKRVIEVRLADRARRAKSADQAALRSRAREVLARRADCKLEELSDDELKELAK